MQISDNTVLITGGASGIGFALARRFLDAGNRVIACGRREAKLREAQGIDARLETLGADVSTEAGRTSLVEQALTQFPDLNVLVNNAGISGSAEQDLYDTAAWNRLMGINATGVFLGMKYAIAAMKKAGNGGSVINLSSISGIVGQGYIHVGYNASKGAVRLITKAAAAQHGRDRIRVNSVHPGLMPPMRTSGRTADPETRAKTLKGVPMGRAGEVDEVAYAILFLASDESSYVTGAEIVVDGGWTAV